MTKRRLGKGLQALIPEAETAPVPAVTEVETAAICVNPNQPRKSFAQTELEELARSVAEHGILQPLIVRPLGGAYELVAGERRLRAARMAGLQKVPVAVRSFSREESLEVSLIENLQREDLTPLESAEAFQRLIAEFGYSQEQLAERVGKSRSSVANTLRLLTLHPGVRQELAEGRLSEGHARAILALHLEEQPAAARQVIEKGLSVREAEQIGAHSRKIKKIRKPAEPDLYLADLEERLRLACGTAVRIKMAPGGSGKLEILFYCREELERVCELLI
ncbi:MAG: putative chromosome-partitioning protein ParB [Syntrophomonadaceae bacterium]|nr:putative chromosome-partitioning protein ParB [Bacillota bacterium]